jgi:translation initiation factor IF-1
MSATGVWRVEGVIVAELGRGLYRARLANGHELLAFVAGRAKQTAPCRRPGEKVNLVVSSFDLSKGRIVAETEQKK